MILDIELSPRLEQIWKSRTVKWAIPGSFILAAFWGLLDKPSPGIAVGILGAAAALMSLRGEIHIFEKAAWIAIIFALVVAEVLAIKRSDVRVSR